MKRFYTVLSLVYLKLSVYAGLPAEVADVRSQSLGKIRAISETALNSSYLSFAEEKRAGFSVMNHYEITDLNTTAIYGMFPNRYLDACVRMSGVGYEDYRRWRVQAGFAKKIRGNLSVGINIHHRTTTGVYEEDIPSVTGADIGCNLILSSELRCAMLCENVVDNARNEDFLLSLGLIHAIIPSCHWMMEYTTNMSEIARFSIGIDCQLLDSFRLRAGCYTQTLSPTFGLSFSWNRYMADVACDKHAYLGYSTNLGVSYRF